MTFSMHGRAKRATSWLALATVAGAVLLAGCGDKKEQASQTAVRVNKDEITVHQINFVLQQQRNLRPEQADAAGRQILERLVDQQLALQRADELKLDRDPRVVQQIEAARREIIARAYAEKIGEAATKPTPEDIKAYYAGKPALFSERRIYNIQEIAIEARPEQHAGLRAQLAGAKNITEFIDHLKANDFRFVGNQAVRAAEQLPLNSVDSFAKMKDGQAVMLPSANGVQVIVLAGSRLQPLSEEQAQPLIERFLLSERKRKLAEDDLKALRAAATIDYVGKFAQPASAAASTAESAPPAASAAAPAGEMAAPASPAAPAASTALSPAEISKGMGLK